MASTQIMSSAVASELLQSMGMELSIFAITIVLAIIFRSSSSLHQKAVVRPLKASNPSRKQNEAEQFNKPGAARISSSEPKNHPWNSPKSSSSAQSMRTADVLTQKVGTMLRHAHRRQSELAIEVYDDLRAKGEHTAIKDHMEKSRPTDAYALLVQCAAKAGRSELVVVLLDDMKLSGLERPLAFYEATMKMLAANKCHKEAIAVYSRLDADGHEPSAVTLSCLINFAAEIGDAAAAEVFFNRLAANATPSIRAYMTILRVYSKRPDWAKSIALLRDMQSRKATIDSLILNVVLATGVAAGELPAAKGLLNEFSQMKIADVVSYNTIMKGLAQQKESNRALKLLDEMAQAGLRANAITFNTAIDAAVRSSRIADAWGVLVRMLDAGLSPDKFTCTTLMKGLQTGATSEQLTVILNFLRSVTAECDLTLRCFLFRSVIEATAQVNDPVLTAKAIAQMREQRVMLSTEEYQRLLRVLMRTGEADNKTW